MDINSIKTLETSMVEILDPITYEKTDIKVEVYGQDSKEFKKLSSSLRAKNLSSDLSEDDKEKNIDLHYASCVVSWQNVEEKNDKGKLVPIECTTENVLRVFSLLPWLKDQVIGHIIERSNFLERKGSN